MKLRELKRKASLLLAGLLAVASIPTAGLLKTAADTELKDAAQYATITDDGTCSAWESLEGVINADSEPTKSATSGIGWGNWPQDPGNKNYLQLEWTEAITTSSFSVYWYQDTPDDSQGGVHHPSAISFEYKDGNGEWQPLNMQSQYEDVVKLDQYNTIQVDEVTTKGIRMYMTVAENSEANGVLRWKVWTDNIPESMIPEGPKPEEPSADLSLPDVAVYATASTDYVPDWNTISRLNDPTLDPANSSIGEDMGYGNWSSSPGQVRWLQYDWPDDITTKTFQIYWHGDAGGMKLPGQVAFQYMDADGIWQDAEIFSDPRNYLKFNKYNQITLKQPVTTKAIRMNMTVATGATCCGVYRWKVFSDISDDFAVGAAAKQLSIPEVIDGRVASSLYKQLTLASSSSIDSAIQVSWASSNPNVVSDAGVVTPPDENTSVTMTATCKKDNIEKTKEIKFLVLAATTTDYKLTIDQANKGVDISQQLFGLFYEDINSAADGGLSAELIKNNSFQNYQNMDSATAPKVKGDQASWKLHWNSSNAANFVVEHTDGLNENNQNYAKITGNMTLSNHGFVEKAKLDQAAIAIKNGLDYDFSMYMKADASYGGKVSVKVVNDAGEAITNEAQLELVKDGKWNKIKTKLTGTQQVLGTLVLTFADAAATDSIYIDMVSLSPTDTYGYGNRNYSYGAGIRKDLVEKLEALNPSFIRFPGGCVIEGSYGTDGYYNWEDSIGPLEERHAIASYWGTSGHPETGDTPGYGYMMSYQFGYHEILQLCEDLGAEPFPIMSAGIFCQFRTTAGAVTPDTGLEKFAQHATHLIDYCWGDPNSEDETEAYWAGKRVANGHAEPFNLNYIGIGNENWDSETVSYSTNFKWMKNYVDDFVNKHYPGRKIHIISSTGPYYQGSQNTSNWAWLLRDGLAGDTLVDEHYYINYGGDSGNTLLNGDYAYDSYKRLDEGGSEVFVGEYAGHNNNTRENVLDTAISEAAYMTGFERNGDIVRHASYAPMLEKEGCRDWNYNMIKFDAYSSYGTPSYYVQKMYANNYGKHIINTTLQKFDNGTSAYKDFGGHQTELYYVSSQDDNNIYLKLVNHDARDKEITLSYPGVADGAKVEITCLSGNAMDLNTINNPEKVVPVTTEATLQGETMIYKVPAMSFTVLKVETNKSPLDPQPETVDKSALQAAYTQAQTLKEADYTADSFVSFKAALEYAKGVLDNSAAKQSDVSTALEALRTAQAQLVKAGSGSGTDNGNSGNGGNTSSGSTSTGAVSTTGTTAITHLGKGTQATQVKEGMTVPSIVEKATQKDGSVVEKTTIPQLDDFTSAVVTAKIGTNGMTDAAAVVKTEVVDGTKEAVITGDMVKNLSAAANGENVSITMTVRDTSGDVQFRVKAESTDLVPGEKLRIYKQKGKELILVNDKEYTVSASGGVSVSMTERGLYRLVSEEDAEVINEQIEDTVKLKKKSASLDKKKSMAVSFAKVLNMENVKSISYTSTKKAVAAVSKSGKVTAKKAGTTTIKVKVTLKNGTKKTLKLKIKVK